MPRSPARSTRRATPSREGHVVRAGVYLVLGGIVAAAYVLLAQAFAHMLARPDAPVGAVVALVALTAVLGLVPPFLASVRTLEVLAARTFLDVDVPVPVGAPSVATRWRAATWYGLHLALGTVVVAGLLVLVPVALELAFAAFGVDPFGDDVGGRWDALPPVAWAAIAVAMLAAVPAVTVLGARVLRQAAPALLGPDQSERIAELEAADRRLAERARLARELHDSVGHALTVTTLQAAAAARTLERDPAAARRALAAIEETGRVALADLDHVLGLLRDDRPRGDPAHTPRTLADVPALVRQVRAGGVDVRLEPGAGAHAVDGAPTADEALPRAVSHEAYRVVQESVTNAVRHAPGAPVTVGVHQEGADLVVEVRNPIDGSTFATDPAARARPRPLRAHDSRGVAGMRGRVEALGGHLAAGTEPNVPASTDADVDVDANAGSARWTVRATFPLPAGTGRGRGSPRAAEPPGRRSA